MSLTRRLKFLRRKNRPPVLYDDAFYRMQNEDVRAVRDGWKHFCMHGFLENRNPHPLFNTGFYRRKHMSGQQDMNPVLHYLQNDDPLATPHPMFDAEHYANRLDQLPSDVTLLEHYLQSPLGSLQSASAVFDSQAYLAAYSDVAECQVNPLLHFLKFGIQEDRLSFVDERCADELYQYEPIDWMQRAPYLRPADFLFNLVQSSKKIGGKNTPTILCVAEDATRSYGSRIVASIAAYLKRQENVNVVTLLRNSGVLIDRFDAVSSSCSMESDAHDEQHRNAVVKFAIETAKLFTPACVLVDERAWDSLAGDLSTLNVPIQIIASEANENGSISKLRIEALLESCRSHADRIVLPPSALEESNDSYDQVVAKTPGIIDEWLCTSPSQQRIMEIRARYKIPADATVVVGCGKHGANRFVSTVTKLLSLPTSDSIYFGWLDYEFDEESGGTLPLTTEVANRIVQFDPKCESDAFDVADVALLGDNSPTTITFAHAAMSRALPVVTVGGQEYNDGQCFPPIPDSSDGGATEILNWCRDRQHRLEVGRKNREYAKQHLQFDDYMTELLRPIALKGESHNIKLNQSASDASRRRRVFLLSPSWEVSGVNTFTELLTEGLNNRGYEACVLLTNNHPMQLPPERMPRVPYQFLGATRPPNRVKNRRLAEFLTTMAPAVVIPNFDYRSSMIASQLPDSVRTIGILHSDDADHYTHGYRMGHNWDRIVSVSGTIEQKLLQLNPAFAEKSLTINYGVNAPDDVVNHANEAEQVDELRIVYSGRLVQQQKRILDFADLLTELEGRHIPFQLTMIGDGSEADELRKMAAPFVESGKLRMLGRLQPNEIYAELSQHHAICLMSDYEGLPLSLLEGLACGCVPIMTQIESGVSEILQHEENALISPLRNPALMADNLAKLFHDNALRRRLARVARPTLVNHQLTASQMVDRYEQVLSEVFESIGKEASKTIPPFWRCRWVNQLLDAA